MLVPSIFRWSGNTRSISWVGVGGPSPLSSWLLLLPPLRLAAEFDEFRLLDWWLLWFSSPLAPDDIGVEGCDRLETLYNGEFSACSLKLFAPALPSTSAEPDTDPLGFCCCLVCINNALLMVCSAFWGFSSLCSIVLLPVICERIFGNPANEDDDDEDTFALAADGFTDEWGDWPNCCCCCDCWCC